MNPNDILHGASILLVEDDPDLLEVLADGLEMFGARTIRATNGLEAMTMFSKQKVDLIISDIRMPVCDGIEFLQNLRRNEPSHPPFFFLTAFSDPEFENAAGASGMYYKPVGIDVLAQTALSVLYPLRK